MRQANLFMMSAAMLLAACGGTKDAGKTDQVLIEKSNIKIEGKRMTPEALWAMGRIGGFAVSPDGKKIAYTVAYYSVPENKSNREVFVMNADGSDNRQITRTPYQENEVTWIKGGTKLAFLSNDNGSSQLYEMNPDGSERKQLTNYDGDIEGYSISPDGKKLLFISQVKTKESTADKHPDLPKATGIIITDLMYKHWDEWVPTAPHPFVADFDGNGISNIVDITNYIMRELGQPLHAFDCDYLEGNAICVRRATEGEKIVTLDEKEFTLNTNNLVICDGKKPVALAGIMGGLNSEIRDTTTEVMFEAAKFARDNIRKSSRALGQSSDASQRYAKGVDEYATEMAMKRALHLVEELGAGKVSKTHKNVNTGNSLEPKTFKTSIKKVNGVLGITVPDEDILRILKGLDFDPEINGDELTLHFPAYREDMEDYPDVAEEVIRMYGYDHINSTFLPTAKVTIGGTNLRQKTILKVKRALCSVGAFEGMHYSFFSPADLDEMEFPEDALERKAIRIMNPINEDLSLMRTTLAPQMIHAMGRNQKRGIFEGRIFEIGNAFIPKSLPLTEYPEERETLCIGAFGKDESFFTLKGMAETVADVLHLTFTYERTEKPFLHPYRTAAILCEGEVVGYLGQVKYEIMKEEAMREDAYVLEINMKALEKWYGKAPVFEPLPKFAEEKRDLALVMNKDITCGQVEECIYQACSFVKDVTLFDVYEGQQIAEDKKSMAFTVLFTPKEEAFQADTVDGYVKKILKQLKKAYEIELRS